MNPMVDPMPMKYNKFIVTIRKGQDLRLGERDSSLFKKRMNPFCELSLGDQGPYHTSIQTDTKCPEWEDSIEFTCLTNECKKGEFKITDGCSSMRAYKSRFRQPEPGMPSQLKITCYSRETSIPSLSPGSRAGASATASDGKPRAMSSASGSRAPKAFEIGRAEVHLSVPVPNGGRDIHISLFRKAVKGLPEATPQPQWRSEDDRVCALGAPSFAIREYRAAIPSLPDAAGRANGNPRGARRAVAQVVDIGSSFVQNVKEQPPRVKLTALGAMGAIMLAAAARYFSRGAPGGSILPEIYSVSEPLTLQVSTHKVYPIRAPFTLRVGTHKASRTHHIRLKADGGVIMALGPDPCTDRAIADGACQSSDIIWQSGRYEDLDPEAECTQCQIKVDRDGRIVLWKGKNELRSFGPITVAPGARSGTRGWLEWLSSYLSTSTSLPPPLYFADGETMEALRGEELARDEKDFLLRDGEFLD